MFHAKNVEEMAARVQKFVQVGTVQKMTAGACARGYNLMDHDDEMPSVLVVLGVARYGTDLGERQRCPCLQIVANESWNVKRVNWGKVKQQQLRARDDGKSQERSFEFLALYSPYCAYDTRILPRPVSFKAERVTGDPLEIE
jgi:hypothetical protein